jgi:uncharacterized repeat protein (TIGR01451 family)
MVPVNAAADTHVWQSDVEGNWNDAGNWNPAQVPAAGDNIGFWDGHHGNCVINEDISVGWFDTSGYNGIIKQSGGDIETTGDFNIYGGSLVTTNNHTLNIGTTAGQFRVGKDGEGAESADLSDAGNVAVSGHLILYEDADDTATVTLGSQTVTIGETMYIDGDQPGSTGGTLNAASATIKIGGSWDSDGSTADFNCQSSTVESTCGTGVNVGWDTKDSNPFNDFSKTGDGTLWMESDWIVNGNFSVSSGTFRQDGDGGERQLTLKGNSSISSGVTWEYSTDTPSILFNGGDTQEFTADGQTFGDVQTSASGTNVEMQNGSATFDAFTIDNDTTFALDSAAGNTELNITSGETLTNNGTFKIITNAARSTLQGSGGNFTFAGNEIDYNEKTLSLANCDYQVGVNLDDAGDQITLGGTCIFDDITIAAGNLSSNDYSLEASGDWEISGTGSYTTGASEVTLSGAGKTITTSSSNDDAFYDLAVSGSYTLEEALDVTRDLNVSGTLDAKDSEDNNLTVARNITVADGGTLTARGSTITITGDGTFDVQGTFNDNTSLVDLQGTGEIKGDWWIDFYDLQCGAAGETTSLNLEIDWQGIDINNSLTVGTGTLDEAIANQKISLYGATVTNNGTIDITEFQTEDASTCSINGGDYGSTIMQVLDGSTLNLTGSVTSSGDWRIGYLATSSGLNNTLNLNNNNITSSGTIRVGEENTDRWGILNCGSGNLEAAAIITRKQFDASSNVIDFGSGTHEFSQDATFENAAVTLSSNTITVGGNFYAVTNGTITHNSGTLILNGNSSTDLRMDGTNNLFNLTVDKDSAANTVTFEDTNDDLQLEGALNIQDGTLDITDTIVIDGAVTIGDGADQASTLKSTTDSLSFTFNDDVNIASDGSFDFQADSQTIRFDNEAGDLVDIAAGGSFIVKGTPGNLATLTNDAGTDKWHIHNANAQDQSANLAHVTVSYSDASGGNTIQPDSTAVDGDNNINWLFGGGGADQIAGTVYQQDEASVITQDADVYMSLYDASEAKQIILTTTATANVGTYSFANLDLAAGDVAAVYINDHGTYEATTGIRTDADGAVDVDLYDEHTIVRSDSGSITNANLDSADDGDGDIHYEVTGVDISYAGIDELYIWAGGTYEPGGAISLVEHVDIRGTLTLAGNDVSRVDGDWVVSGAGSFTTTTNTVTFWASNQTNTIMPNGSDFYNLTFYTPHALVTNTWNIGDTLQTNNNLACGTGTINFNDEVIIVKGDLILSNGAEVNASSSTITVSDDFTYSAGGGTDFNHDTSTVVFDDDSKVSNISGDFIFYNMRCTTGNKEINFTNGTNHTIANTLTVTGTSGNLVKLHSSLDDNKWDLTLTGGDQTISFADIKDGDANGGTVTCYNSEDSGNNNANWIFDDLDITTPQAGKTVGQTPTIRGDAGAGDVVTIVGTTGGAPFQTVAQVTADANGNYIVSQSDYTATLDAGANIIRADIGGTIGSQVPLTVSAAPTVNQVPIITSPADGSKISNAAPALSGQGLAGQNVTVSAWDANGNLLLTDVANAVVGVGGIWNINSANYSTPLVKGTNYLIVTVDGVASDVISLQFTDPFGIVFDSSTDEPIANATVTIYNQDGSLCVPGVDIAGGDINPQTTGANGFYSFLCANGNYYITVEAPGHTYPSRKTTFPTGRTIVAGSKGELFTVAGVIIEMDHPMDSDDLLLKIKKEANKKEAVVGDIVTYTVTIKNIGSTDVSGVFLEDKIPGGFKYVNDRAILDNVPTNPAGSTNLLFDIGTVAAQETRILKYQLIVGSGVSQGNYENRAWARYSDETVISNKDSSTVKVTLDPLFDLGNVIGKVFWDKNENGFQDEGENPIAFVSIATEDGTVVTTDRNGRYHIPALKPGRHILRLDESTLPQGSYLTTDKAVIIDVTNGLLNKVNFGVNKSEAASAGAIKIVRMKEPVKPLLNISLYPDKVILPKDNLLKPAEGIRNEFRIFTNYPLFIDRWQIEVLEKDTKETVKVFKGNSQDIGRPIYWDSSKLEPDKNYSYILKVYDKNHNEDITLEKNITIIQSEGSLIFREDKKAKSAWIEKESSLNSLKTQKIEVKGDTVLIQNPQVFESAAESLGSRKAEITSIYVDGAQIQSSQIPQSKDKKYEIIVPEGEHKILASGTDNQGGDITASKEISVSDDYLFFVAMGDAKAGYTFHTGNIDPIQQDDKYREGFWSEGKLAYYLKGKVLGKFLITSSLDTDRDQKELFRNLDPDKYYPVYGDASKIDYKATDTQGPLYLLVEWDKSSFVWGNYTVDLTDTDLAGFKRTLYGAKLDYETVAKTKFGQPTTHLIGFKAKAQQQAAHVEFLGTGGSLFYLKHKNVIEGSEKITIEVRDKISGLVLASMDQEEGFDYEIDYDSGRIIFWQPVSHITESDTIISSYLLNGNPVYVAADYEYEVEDKYDRGVYGGRLEQALGDYFSLGATYVKEEQADKNYQLAGTDASLRLGDKTTVTAEYAETHAEELSSYISTDGGLSFTDLSTNEDTRGRAYGLRASSYALKGLGVEAYYRKIEDNFSSISTSQEQGKELAGGKLTYNLTDRTRISLRHDTQQLIDEGNASSSTQIGADKTETTTAQIIHRRKRLKLTGEYRHQQAEGIITAYESETNADKDLLALKADYKITEDVILSLEQQAAVRGAANNQTTAGIQTRINERLTLRAKQAVGTNGAATSLGASYNISDKLEVLGDYALGSLSGSSTDNSFSLTTKAKGEEGEELYHTYTVAHDDIEGKKYSQVTGTKRTFTNGLEFKMEEEKSLLESEKTNTNIFGLSGDVNDKMAGFVQFERGEVQNLDGSQTKRNALSLGGSYVESDFIKASSKLELRLDKSQSNARQYLSYNTLELHPNEATTLFAKANLSQSDDTSNDIREGMYREFSLAAAYRPVAADNLNFFSKYTYLRDDAPASQEDYENIDEEKAHVIAAEGAYDISQRWQLIEKIALKMAEEKVTGFDFTKSRTWLNVNRLNYLIDENWKVGAEYRFLKQEQAKDYKQGALVEVSRQIGPYAELGLGYNFTDFNDDLAHLDYTSHGPFVRVTGKFYDRSKSEKQRYENKELDKKINQWAYERADGNIQELKGLNRKLQRARGLEAQGNLSQAKELYLEAYNQARAIYLRERDYIKEQIKFEKELEKQNALAKSYYEQGRLKEARRLWQDIVDKIKRSGRK